MINVVKTPNLSGIARALVDRLSKTIISEECGFLAQVLQILVEGHPVVRNIKTKNFV
jgi:hypothetical protein